MGQRQINTSQNKHSPILEQLRQSYQLHKHPLYPNESQIMLLKNINNLKYQVLIIKTINDEKENQIIQAQIIKRQHHKYAHLTKLQYHYKQYFEDYCTKINKHYLLFDIGDNRTLKDQIDNPTNFLREQKNLLNGLKSLIYGLIEAKHNQMAYLNLNTANIYIINQQMILNDPEFPNNKIELKYHSPEKIESIWNYNLTYNKYASDLFTIGMIILQASKGYQLQKVYKAKNMGINFQVLIKEIDGCKFQNLKKQLKILLLSSRTNRQKYFLQQQQIHINLLKKDKQKRDKPTAKILLIGAKYRNKRQENILKNEQLENKQIKKLPIIQIHENKEHIINGNMKQNMKKFKLNNTNNIFEGEQIFKNQLQTQNQKLLKQQQSGAVKINFNYFNKDQPNIDMIMAKIKNFKEQDSKIGYFKPNNYLNDNYNSSQKISLFSRQNQDIKKVESHYYNQVDYYNDKSKLGVFQQNKNLKTQQFEKTLALSKELANYYSHHNLQSRTNFPSSITKLSQDNLNLNFDQQQRMLRHIKQSILQQKKMENFDFKNYKIKKQKEEEKQRYNSEFDKKKKSQVEFQDENIKIEIKTVPQLINKPQRQPNQSYIQYPFLRQNNQNKQNLIEQVNSSMENNNAYSLQEFYRINQIYSTQLERVSNIQIPEQSSSQEQSFDSRLETQRKKLQYLEEQYENGGKYKGQMLIDGERRQRYGHGCFYYKEGGYFEGNWKHNKMNGKGKLFYDNGKLAYDGQWYMDQFHGRGKIFNDSPQMMEGAIDYINLTDIDRYWVSYEGDLAHDEKEGHGKLTFSNGEYYEGNFIRDHPEGKGHFYGLQRVIHGIWANGVFIKQL